MAAVATISIADGKTPPVSHTFNVLKVDRETGFWENRSPGVPLGFEGLQLAVKRPANLTQQGAVYRVNLKLMVPTLEVTSPATGTGIQPGPTLAYTTWASVEFILPARGSFQDRKDLRTLLANALSNAIVIDAIENLANPY